jgi:hypothetical protein
MQHYVGLDVSLKQTAVCVVDQAGKIIREGMVASEPEAIADFIAANAPQVVRIEHLKMRRRDAEELPLRSCQCAVDACCENGRLSRLGHAHRKTQEPKQGPCCGGAKTCCHPAPDVDRRHRVQLVIGGNRYAIRLIPASSSRREARKIVPAGTWRWRDRPWLCDACKGKARFTH